MKIYPGQRGFYPHWNKSFVVIRQVGQKNILVKYDGFLGDEIIPISRCEIQPDDRIRFSSGKYKDRPIEECEDIPYLCHCIRNDYNFREEISTEIIKQTIRLLEK